MAGSCTVKSSGGLYLTWDPARAVPSPVHLAAKASIPGAFWNLGYGGFEMKVGTPGLTFCLGLAPGPAQRHRYRVDLTHCTGRRGQKWTLTGTTRLGSHIAFLSVAHDTMCLTALPGAGRSAHGRSTHGRSTRATVVVERCAPGRGFAPDQTWSI